MARSNDLNRLTYAQLIALEEKIRKAIADRRLRKHVTRQQLKNMAKKAGCDINELFGKRGRKGSSSVKYRNPKDPTQTWTGRGRKPNWLVDALKKGGKLDSFAV